MMLSQKKKKKDHEKKGRRGASTDATDFLVFRSGGGKGDSIQRKAGLSHTDRKIGLRARKRREEGTYVLVRGFGLYLRKRGGS